MALSSADFDGCAGNDREVTSARQVLAATDTTTHQSTHGPMQYRPLWCAAQVNTALMRWLTAAYGC